MKAKLSGLWKKWLFVAGAIGNIVSRIMLLLLYFTVFSIPGIASRLFSDKLQTKKKKTSYWIDIKDKIPKDIEESRNQG